jgi:hypothetical protein
MVAVLSSASLEDKKHPDVLSVHLRETAQPSI